jgi:SAM-dependent methyltransferase
MPNIPDRIAWTVDLLDPQTDDTILEIGCGNGAAVSLIAPRLQTGVITAIDRSPNAVARATAVNRDHIASGTVRILQATLQDLEPEGEGYGKIFAVNVNAFWLQPEKQLPAARRHLAPGGTLLLVLEAPSAARARHFLATMPAHLEHHGFSNITSLTRTDKTAAVLAKRRP